MQRLELLIESLELLSSEPAVQLEYLESLGIPDGIDELALEFDTIAGAATDMRRCQELNDSQFASILRLDEELARMSGEANARLWTAHALLEADEWKFIRVLAENCLAQFDRPT